MKKKGSIGSTFDDFLKEEGAYEDAQAVAIKRVLAWRIEKDMKRKHMLKVDMARRMHTSRSQRDRLLDTRNGSGTMGARARAGRVISGEVRRELG